MDGELAFCVGAAPMAVGPPPEPIAQGTGEVVVEPVPRDARVGHVQDVAAPHHRAGDTRPLGKTLLERASELEHEVVLVGSCSEALRDWRRRPERASRRRAYDLLRNIAEKIRTLRR